MIAFRGVLSVATALMLVSATALAAEEKEAQRPMSMNLDKNLFGPEFAPKEDQAFEFSFENYQPGPKVTPPPKVAAPAEPVNWLKTVALSAVGLVAVVVLAFYFRWLYYDNVFGPTYHFPAREVTIRLGGAYGGGHGAVVRFKRQ